MLFFGRQVIDTVVMLSEEIPLRFESRSFATKSEAENHPNYKEAVAETCCEKCHRYIYCFLSFRTGPKQVLEYDPQSFQCSFCPNPYNEGYNGYAVTHSFHLYDYPLRKFLPRALSAARVSELKGLLLRIGVNIQEQLFSKDGIVQGFPEDLKNCVNNGMAVRTE